MAGSLIGQPGSKQGEEIRQISALPQESGGQAGATEVNCGHEKNGIFTGRPGLSVH
jgi:hypothetical protein